jgi:hypothetical protein
MNLIYSIWLHLLAYKQKKLVEYNDKEIYSTHKHKRSDF